MKGTNRVFKLKMKRKATVVAEIDVEADSYEAAQVKARQRVAPLHWTVDPAYLGQVKQGEEIEFEPLLITYVEDQK